MQIHHVVRDVAWFVLLGSYPFALLRYGKHGWSSTPADLSPVVRGVWLWFMTTLWGLLMFDFFLEHHDGLPLLAFQLITVLLVETSIVLFYVTRDNKTKQRIWRYSAFLSCALVIVFSWMHAV